MREGSNAVKLFHPIDPDVKDPDPDLNVKVPKVKLLFCLGCLS